MTLKGILALAASLMMSATWACDQHGQTGIAKENDLYISVDDKNAAGISKKQFNQVIDNVIELYEGVVNSHNKELVVMRKWDDGTVNAYAKQEGDQWQVHMFGGLARHETITEDGFALVVCHELGHHLAGAPRKKHQWTGQLRWASNEGQADYWATMKCLRKYFQKKGDNRAVVSRMKVPTKLKQKCNATYSSRTDRDMCVRTTMAGHSLASLFSSLRSLTEDLSFVEEDPKVVTTTYHSHPMPQCRLDTYFSASLCKVKAYVDTDYDDPNIGTCSRHHGAKAGVRPLCWYKPSEYKPL